jgi:hypothetical protein
MQTLGHLFEPLYVISVQSSYSANKVIEKSIFILPEVDRIHALTDPQVLLICIKYSSTTLDQNTLNWCRTTLDWLKTTLNQRKN